MPQGLDVPNNVGKKKKEKKKGDQEYNKTVSYDRKLTFLHFGSQFEITTDAVAKLAETRF